VQLGWTIRRSSYFDSIALMRVAEDARLVPGVLDVALVMATPANRAMLADAGLWSAAAPDAAPDDLLVAVRAKTDEAVRRALARIDQLLVAPRESAPAARDDVGPRTILSAARRAGSANLALIAVPGTYAAVEAHQALSAGLHVFLFSDGVALADEISLKRRARERGLLVMGPECGTAIIDGVGLGFANRVRRGAIGVVGASGTGIQEITSLVHRLGGGISQAIGTGGRDLHAAVGGITTLQALRWLAAHDATRVVVIVSKPSSREVANEVLAAAGATGKPSIACLLGYEGPSPKQVQVAATLEDAARAAVRLAGGAIGELERSEAPRTGTRGSIVGLFTGGTLCEEARRLVGGGHRFVDFGAEEYTRGRPHPIIDPARRHAAILEAADDIAVAVLLLDVVLGDCAHPDPAGALAPVLTDARDRARRRGRELTIVAHVVGTDDDPQRLGVQESVLRKLGATVCPSNRLAAITARQIVGGRDAG
jgi:succinyl-CoA synthetase alpha subunit